MEFDSKPLRWGIIGTGTISQIIINAIHNSPDSEVIAAWGRTPGNLEALANTFQIPHRHDSMEALLEDPDVDVLYIGLPSSLHKDAVLAALKHGKKAILCEKTLATEWEDAIEIDRALRSTEDVFFFEGYMYLCHPFFEKLGEIIKSGRLGEIKSFEGHYSVNVWNEAKPLGKSTIYNLAGYPVSLIQWAMECAVGPEAFAAPGRRIYGDGNVVTTGTDGRPHVRDASLTARFANGVLATVQVSDSSANGCSFMIQGTDASLRVVTNPWWPVADQKGNVMEIKSYDLMGNVTEDERIEVGGEWDAFGYEVRKVEDGVKRGLREPERPAVGWEQSLEIMRLLSEWEDGILKRWKSEQVNE